MDPDLYDDEDDDNNDNDETGVDGNVNNCLSVTENAELHGQRNG